MKSKTSGLVLGMWVGAGVLVAGGVGLSLAGGARFQVLGAALVAGGVVGAFVAMLANVVAGQLEAAANEAARQRASAVAGDSVRMEAFLGELRAALASQPAISERAKEIAFRDRDRDVVRQAVREEVQRGNWTGAEALIERMEKSFASPADAAKLREELAGMRMGAIRNEFEKVREMVARFAGIEDWNSALREARGFTERYPELVEARGLPAEVEARKRAVKEHLLERWHEAVRNKDDEAGMTLLRKLDAHLTPAEAEHLAEDARALLADRRTKLREGFTAAIANEEWATAMRLAETIQAEFPNSKVANEIRASMDELRERAAGGGTGIFST